MTPEERGRGWATAFAAVQHARRAGTGRAAAPAGAGGDGEPRREAWPRLEHLRRARDHIDRCYEQPLDLRAMARAASSSPWHFARAFADAYGETPARYVTRRRVERAMELLRGTDLPVTEVCWRVGFSSLGSFSTRFRELVGVPPSGYRRACARQVVVPACFAFMWTRPAGTDRKMGEAPAGDPFVG